MLPFLNGVDNILSSQPCQSNLNGRTEPLPSSRRISQAKSSLRSCPTEDVFDLICIGFGPASLAIAIALHDTLSSEERKTKTLWRPNVCFLERQTAFGWHTGMLLPGSKMQISFIKDLATLRDPTSHFTFLNYLKLHRRLVHFSNLGTFLPSRLEFEDYMRWCAGHFSDVVEYGEEVLTIIPGKTRTDPAMIDLFTVQSMNVKTREYTYRNARQVVIAIGGRPFIPTPLLGSPRVIHSSTYCRKLPELFPSKEQQHHIAVVGSGQSAAEIFNDIHTRYPNLRSTLIIRDSALRPSDDSPFVNEVFDPERVDSFYRQSQSHRRDSLKSDRSTNYGVVRLELLEQIYHTLYTQRLKQPDESQWQHRILPSRKVVNTLEGPQSDRLLLTLQHLASSGKETEELIEVDAVIAATGYTRDAHEDMLENIKQAGLLKNGEWHIGRDYKLQLCEDLVAKDTGIWLQGSNEITHGISDTLLSILATRSGEIVESIFGDKLRRTRRVSEETTNPEHVIRTGLAER